MIVDLNKININSSNRIRKDVGDLFHLMQSIKKYGLLQPLVVDNNFNLLAGYRRFQALRNLGITSAEVVKVNAISRLEKLEIEMDENIARRDFTFEEVDAAYELKEKLLKPSVLKKILNFFKKIFNR